MDDFDKAKSENKLAFRQLGDDEGEGGQRDIKADIRSSEDAPSEEFAGMAKTGEQSFAKGGEGAGDKGQEKS